MKKNLFFIVALIFLIAATANADYYSWEDESGTMHITDYPPPQNQKKSQNVKIYEKSSSIKQAEQPSAQTEKKPDITLYTKNDCPDCDKAREFLNSKKLTFTEYNMDKDQTVAAKRKAIDDSKEVPFAIINRNQVYGFSEPVYNRTLKPSP